MTLNPSMPNQSGSSEGSGHNRHKALEAVLPYSQDPAWHTSPAKSLELIPGFIQRYEALKKCIESGQVSRSDDIELRQFPEDFFAALEACSSLVVEQCGVGTVIATLELFAASRAMMWPSTSYEYWGRLPDQLDVFRVGSGTFEEVLGGFSWYLRRDFAELFVDPSENRIVLRGEISRDDLIFVSTAHTEVVFRRPPRRASHFNPVQII